MVLENKIIKFYENWVKSTKQEQDMFIPLLIIPFTKTDNWSGYMVMEFSKYLLLKTQPLSKKDMVLKWCKGRNYIDKHKAWERFNRIMSYSMMNQTINQYLEKGEVKNE